MRPPLVLNGAVAIILSNSSREQCLPEMKASGLGRCQDGGPEG